MDLADPEDYKTISVLLNTQESLEKERRVSAVPGLPKREPAWFRRESMQRDPGTLGDTAALLKAKVGGSFCYLIFTLRNVLFRQIDNGSIYSPIIICL